MRPLFPARAAATLGLALGLALPQAAPAKDVALVVVNAAYRDITDFDPGPVADIVGSALTDAGFEVVTIRNATSGILLSALRRMSTDPDPNGAAVFYYTGYARQLRDKNYVLTKNARLEQPFDFITHGIDVDSILRAMATAGGRAQIAVIDGAYPAAEVDGLPDLEPGFARPTVEGASAVILGTPPGQTLATYDGSVALAEAFAASLGGPGRDLRAIATAFEAEVGARSRRGIYVALGEAANEPLLLEDGAEPVAATFQPVNPTQPVQPAPDATPEPTATPAPADPAAEPAPGSAEPEPAPAPEVTATEPGSGQIAGLQPAPGTEPEGQPARAGFVPAPETPPAPEPEPEPLSAEEFEAQLTDPERREIQVALQRLGLYLLAIDGDFGRGTRRAIRTFQRLRGFAATGILNAAQTQVLLEVSDQ